MTAKPSGKTGWTQHEQDILFEQAKKARDLGLPLKAAFDQTARLTGRQPNSIRNFYYAKIKEEGLEAPMGASAFIPFTDEEIRHLLEQVLTLQAQGMSVRSITLKLGQGDRKAMLRYQNKYRSLLKNNRPLVEQTIQALRAAGKPAYDPYHEPRISKAGRKPQNQRAQELDQALVGAGRQPAKGFRVGYISIFTAIDRAGVQGRQINKKAL